MISIRGPITEGFNSEVQTRERFMGIGEDKRDTMRYTIMVLITLTAFGLLLAGEGAIDIQHVMQDNLSPKVEPPETDLMLTSSMASFLNDSWAPSPYVADVYTALAAGKNGTVANSSNLIYDFLNGTWNPSAPVPPVYTAVAPGKNGTIAWSTENIYEFLRNDWTPQTPVVEYTSGAGYTRHQMS
jgi:hypothetical protein